MSESNVTEKIHDLTKSVKAKPPGTKLDYPPAAFGVLDAHSDYFATNAMLAPLLFSSIGVLRSKLRADTTNEDDLAELGGIDAFNEMMASRGATSDADDHSFEIGYDPAERSTIDVVKFAFTLRRQQVMTGFRLYGKDNPYPPYSLTNALAFLIESEPRDNSRALKTATATLIDQELAELGVDLDELHADEGKVILAREEANKATLREQQADIMAAFKEAGTIDLVDGWNKTPLLIQYKCLWRNGQGGKSGVIASLKKALARKTALIKTNPKHPNSSQMANEKNPLAEVIHTLTLDCHSVYRANRDLFDEAMMNGIVAELPKLGEVKKVEVTDFINDPL